MKRFLRLEVEKSNKWAEEIYIGPLKNTRSYNEYLRLLKRECGKDNLSKIKILRVSTIPENKGAILPEHTFIFLGDLCKKLNREQK